MLQQNLSDEIKRRLKISDVVSKKVLLNKKSENRYVALCPFHKEKTPSFNVLDDKGFFHCFGCGKHGDIFNFIMDIKKLDFKEAIKFLSNQAGIVVQESSFKKNHLIFEILEEAKLFFIGKLFDKEGEQVRKYLIERGINIEISKEFSLGYAGSYLKDKITLIDHLLDKGFLIEDICRSGLAKKNIKVDGHYSPYFVDRLMIPIISQYGKVVGFGARILKNRQPKYLNSPENDVFRKRNILFGSYNLKKNNKSNNHLIITEGYMDVIALHKYGFLSVAALGTALTETQIEQSLDLSENIFIVFDGDEAGKNAMLRAFDKILKILRLGKKIKFVFLSDNLDPEEYINRKGLKSFKSSLKNGLSVADMIWFMGLKLKKDDQPESNAIFWKFIREKVNLISNIDLRIAIKDELEKRIKSKRFEHRFLKTNNGKRFTNTFKLPEIGVNLRYKAILLLLIYFPDLYRHEKKNINKVKFRSVEFDQIKDEILKIYSLTPNISTMDIKNILEKKGYSHKLDDFNSKHIFSRFPITNQELNLDKCKLLLNELIYMVSKSELSKEKL